MNFDVVNGGGLMFKLSDKFFKYFALSFDFYKSK